MKNASVLCAAMAAMMWGGPALAQTTGAGIGTFVAVHAGPKWDDVYLESRRTLRPVFEGGMTVGTDGSTAGVEVGLSVSAWHEKRNPVQRFRYAGATSGHLQKDHSYESASTVRRQSPQVSVLFRKNRRVQQAITLTWLLGGAWVYRREHATGVIREVLPDGSLVEVDRQEDRSGRHTFGAVTGLEATVALSSHLAIVPRIQVTGFLNLWDESAQAVRHMVVRPQLAVRWTF